MRQTLFSLLLPLVVAFPLAAGASAPPSVDEPEASRIERFLRIRAPYAPSLAPDGRLYVLDWPDGIFQLYRREQGLDPQAPLQRLTDYEHGVSRYSLSPDGSHVLLAVDSGGDEQPAGAEIRGRS
ncbi:MAG: hypothetical protein ACOC0J_00275 [Myxococcota bacterium]